MKKIVIPFEMFADMDVSFFNRPEITVRNKEGDKVRILCTDGSIPDFPIVGIVEHDDPDDNYPESFTREGHYTTDHEGDYDLVIEFDNEAITEKMGADPLKAAMFASAMFGDPKQYSPEELEIISRLSLAIAG